MSSESRRELAARKLQRVRELLELRLPLMDVKRMFAQEFACSQRSAERYIAKCYQSFRWDTEKSVDDQRAAAHAFYLGIARDTTNSTRDRLRAQERIDKLLGLEAPLQFRALDQSGRDDATPAVSQAEIRIQVTEAIAKVLTHATSPS